MNTVKLDVDGTTHKLEEKPITMLFHQGECDIKPLDSDIVVIDPRATVAWAESIPLTEWLSVKDAPLFVELWEMVMGEISRPDNLANGTLAQKHFAGLLCLLFEAIHANKRPYLRFPETYLHPKQQAPLADLLVRLTKET